MFKKMIVAMMLCVSLFSCWSYGQGPSMKFYRFDSDEYFTGAVLAESGTRTIASSTRVDDQCALMLGTTVSDRNDDSTFDGGVSDAINCLTSMSAVPNAKAEPVIELHARNLNPPGASLAILNHNIATVHIGHARADAGRHADAVADNYTNCYLEGFYETDYRTRRPAADVLGTVVKNMYFLIQSPPEVTSATDADLFDLFDLQVIDFNSFAFTFPATHSHELDIFFERTSLYQRVTIGGSDIAVVHWGDGLYTTDGTLTEGSEGANTSNPTRDFFQVDHGVVNHYLTSTEAMPLDGACLPVYMVQTSRTGSHQLAKSPAPLAGVRGLRGGECEWESGTINWVSSFSTHASVTGDNLQLNE